ncbi:MAG TPA: DUF2059 domain-containing protein [Thermoanaerobaculia bacterium]|jgi:hypothetical protein
MKKTLLAVLALSLLCLGPARAQQTAPAEDAAAKRQDIRKLLEVTGSAKLGQQVLAQMLDSFKSTNSKVPEEFWDQILKEFDSGSLIDLVVPIYEKHLTHEDIKGMLAFYESPLGRKLIEVTPAITQESMTAGQQWGLEIAKRIQKRLEDRPKESKGR